MQVSAHASSEGMVAPDDELPQLKGTLQLSHSPGRQNDQLFDVSFYPYAAPGVDPFFAVTGGCETVILRPARDNEKPVEVVRRFVDEDPEAGLNSCAWTKDVDSGRPWICVAGALPKISILDVLGGTLVKTLIGHGGAINDLAVSPASPQIIASASQDGTVRVWSLEDRHCAQPCAVICAGEGHQSHVLTVAFHVSGRYLLSAGIDCSVNLWALPVLPNDDTGTDHPTTIHFPHFSSSAVHSDYVDCVMFYGDLILSKCAREGKIVLWRVKGFSALDSPPSQADAPIARLHEPTRSAFGDGGYERLLQFRLPEVEPFYIRFGLFAQPFKHPVLAGGNNASTVFLWDLQQLLDGGLATTDPFLSSRRARSQTSSGGGGTTATTSRSTSKTLHVKTEGDHDASSKNTSNKNSNDRSRSTTSETPTENTALSDPFQLVHAHTRHTLSLPRDPKSRFAIRNIAWSPGGEWMVAVGDKCAIGLFGRWLDNEEYVWNGRRPVVTD